MLTRSPQAPPNGVLSAHATGRSDSLGSRETMWVKQCTRSELQTIVIQESKAQIEHWYVNTKGRPVQNYTREFRGSRILAAGQWSNASLNSSYCATFLTLSGVVGSNRDRTSSNRWIRTTRCRAPGTPQSLVLMKSTMAVQALGCRQLSPAHIMNRYDTVSSASPSCWTRSNAPGLIPRLSTGLSGGRSGRFFSHSQADAGICGRRSSQDIIRRRVSITLSLTWPVCGIVETVFVQRSIMALTSLACTRNQYLCRNASKLARFHDS